MSKAISLVMARIEYQRFVVFYDKNYDAKEINATSSHAFNHTCLIERLHDAAANDDISGISPPGMRTSLLIAFE